MWRLLTHFTWRLGHRFGGSSWKSGELSWKSGELSCGFGELSCGFGEFLAAFGAGFPPEMAKISTKTGSFLPVPPDFRGPLQSTRRVKGAEMGARARRACLRAGEVSPDESGEYKSSISTQVSSF